MQSEAFPCQKPWSFQGFPRNLPAATKESRDENQLTEWDEVLSDGEIEAKPGRLRDVPHQYMWRISMEHMLHMLN